MYDYETTSARALRDKRARTTRVYTCSVVNKLRLLLVLACHAEPTSLPTLREKHR